MKRKTGQGRSARRWLVIALLGAAVLWAAGWLAFVPRAQEPDYQFVLAWGRHGDQPGQFNDPTGIAVADGEVFVSDARNDRIQVFDFDGRFPNRLIVRAWKAVSSASSHANQPHPATKIRSPPQTKPAQRGRRSTWRLYECLPMGMLNSSVN